MTGPVVVVQVADGRVDVFTLAELWRCPCLLRAVLMSSRVLRVTTAEELLAERDARRRPN